MIAPKPQRTRVLQFLTFFYIGGTERQVMNLTTGLDPERFDLHMGCLGKVGEFLAEAVSRNIPVSEYKIQTLHGPGSWYARFNFARYLHRHSIEVAHSYGFYSNLFAIPAARLARVPLVVASIRDCGETLTPMQKHAQKIFCGMADCILANAEGVRRWLVHEGYPARKIHVIRNGIVSQAMSASASGRPKDGSLHREFGFAPGAPLVAVLSRLNAMKGLEHFLEAASRVARTHPGVRFLIIGGASRKGDDTYLRQLEQYAASLGLERRVVFTGFRTDVNRILAEIDISVLPSLSEGLSNSLLESMAAGVPVIATRVGGTPEAVEDGQSGVLVPAGDPRALAEAMNGLLDNPERARSLGQAGRSRVLSQFSIERMVHDTESLYFNLLNEKHSPAGNRQGQRQVVTP